MRIVVPPDVTATADHWYWRPGWAPGRRMVTFHLTWENADAVGALAAAVAPALATVPALDPVPVPWLHLTMTGVGFTDEVSDAALAAVAEPVFAAWKRFGAVELVIEDVLVARESVMLTPAASGWLSELFETQRTAVDTVLGDRTWGIFWPHIALAYAHAAAPAAPIVALLRQALASQPEWITARPTLTLLRLGRDERVYTWEVVESRSSR